MYKVHNAPNVFVDTCNTLSANILLLIFITIVCFIAASSLQLTFFGAVWTRSQFKAIWLDRCSRSNIDWDLMDCNSRFQSRCCYPLWSGWKQVVFRRQKHSAHSLILYACFHFRGYEHDCHFGPYVTFLLTLSFFISPTFLWNFLSCSFCVGGFQRAATKAGSVPYLCIKSMPEKMPTPTCSRRKRPATCTKYNVGTEIFYSLTNKGLLSVGWGSQRAHCKSTYCRYGT